MMKDIFDKFLAVLLLLIFSPLMLIIAIAIKLDSKGPIVFVQERFGRNMRKFNIYKFRTMYVDKKFGEQFISSGKNDPRITKVGLFLRKSRLDELPQLFNIIKGDMSFVGSRPQVKRYIDVYPERYAHILQMKPGITGLSTIRIHEKEDSLMEQAEDPELAYIKQILPHKLRYNEFYVSRQNFLLDLKIIFQTAFKIFTK